MASERRYATVVYADISGFTAISENLDPEQVTDVMNRCFEMIEGVVIAHGGMVNKYLGDCVMAVFGLDDEMANPSQQAVEAAAEIRSSIYRFNKEASLPSPLDVHVGVNSGEVIAGLIGGEIKREFTVTGDTVTIAAKLEDVSDKGQIFVGLKTFRETEDMFEYRPVDPIVLRENEPPVPVYEFLGVKPSHRHVKRDSERRQATVLFADMYGFKALAEKMQPEAVIELLNDCFEILECTVRAYGGVVDKYIGECLMALFGVPNAIENAPQRAINAAIEIRNQLAEFNERHRLPVPIQVHMGLNSGLVIAGEIGGRVKRDFTVMGDTVNLASRLKDASRLGTILVGPETHRYAKDAFEFRAIEPLRLKGKAQPVPAYEVLSERGQVHRARFAPAERSISSELVGRKRELEKLLGHVARLTGGHGAIVSLVGEAGLGKSRLIAEVLARSTLQGVLVLEGRSISMGGNLSFHPFVDLIERWSGISEDDDDEKTVGKLERAIAEVAGDVSVEIFPFVATLMGLRLSGAAALRVQGIEGEALEKLIFRSIRELFVCIARRQPLLLIFEDLHWADRSSIGLLEALLRLVTEHPMLFLNVFRPDYQDTAEHIMTSALENYADWYDEIYLDPLEEHHAAKLVENLLRIEDLPHSVRQLIIRKAEGNPFYIEEVVRSLIDEGAVEYVDGRYRVTEKIQTVQIPGTIQEVIMARVDRLEEGTRHLLQVASVIGRNFHYSIIAEILRRQNQLDPRLDQELGELKEKQLLIERKAGWKVKVQGRALVDEIEYLFKHALAQQTIYESLLQKTRKEFHGTVAETIEALFSDRIEDFYGMLAYHYSHAEHVEKAEQYLFKAGEVAARSAASSEALNFFREASRLYLMMHGDGGDPLKKMVLEKNIGIALLNSGQLTESIEHFDQALAYLGQPRPSTMLGAIARAAIDLPLVLARVYTNRFKGRPRNNDQEELSIRFNLSRAQTTSDPKRLFFDMIIGMRRLTGTDPTRIDEACGIYTGAATVFVWSGISFAIARKLLSVAHTLIRPGNLRDEFQYRSFLFVLHHLGGDWREENRISDDLVRAAIQIGQFWNVNTYLGLYCEQLIYKGEFPLAERQIETITELADNYGYDFARSNQFAMPAFLYLVQRRLDEALEAVERYYRSRHEPVLHLLALGTKARIQLLAGSPEVAETLAQARALAKRLGLVAPAFHRSMLTTAELLNDVTNLECLLAAGDRSGARRVARAARRNSARAVHTAAIVARERVEAYRLTGLLWWLLKKRSRALRWWQRAIKEGKHMGARPELARTYLEIGRRLKPGEKLGAYTGAEYIDMARRMFAEMDLQRDLELANKAVRMNASAQRVDTVATAAG